MKRKISRILSVNILPPLVGFGLLSAYVFLIFIPELINIAGESIDTGEMFKTLIPYTAGVLVLTAVLFVFASIRSLKTELSRERIKKSYELIDEEYQNWIETTADGFIYIDDSANISANEIVLHMLDYLPEELKDIDCGELIYPDVDGKELISYINNPAEDITGRYETRLVKKDGSNIEVFISASRIRMNLISGIVLIVKDMSEKSRTGAARIDAQREYTLVELQSALQYIYQRAGSIMDDILLFNRDTKISTAVECMNEINKNNFIVVNEKGYAEGIVTDQDLRQKVLSGAAGIDSEVTAVMRSPVVTAGVDIMFFEAFRLMRDNSIRQLVVVDDKGFPIGILSEKRLIETQSTNTASYTEELLRAETVEEMRDCYLRLVFSVRTLVQLGAKASYIVNLVSKTAEIITKKLIELAIEEYGPPPCSFAFIVMGSEGRGEQTLLTDQDNGIIFKDCPEAEINSVREYFIKIGSFVSDSLEYIGYSYCKGGVMASNPKWVRSSSEWRQQVFSWFSGTGQRHLLDLNILFDFKCIFGKNKYADRFRKDLWEAVDTHPGFLRELTAAVSVYKPKLTLLGKIQTNLTDEDDEVFDIKKAISPLILYARTMALREKIEAVSTVERLRALREKGKITAGELRNYEQAFYLLTQLRFRDQVQTIEDGEPLSNLIYVEDLSEVELSSLSQIFKQISSAQDKLRLEMGVTMRN